MEKSGNFVVTLGRQFGCGAREIGQMVAKMLDISYYDKELLLEAAKQSGVAPAIFEASDERTPKFFSSLWSFNLGYYSGTLFAGDQPVKEDNVYQAQSQVMVDLAHKGPCVIVGRSADYILRNREDLVRVFILAGTDFRIRTLMQRKGIGEDAAKKLLKEVDKDRSSYYKYYTDQIWGESEYYDLCLDSSRIGVEGAVQVIRSYVDALKK